MHILYLMVLKFIFLSMVPLPFPSKFISNVNSKIHFEYSTMMCLWHFSPAFYWPSVQLTTILELNFGPNIVSLGVKSD